MLTRAEVSQHRSKDRCLVIIKGNVYDLSSYLDSHPGGSSIILKYGGRDATEAFEPIHPNNVIEKHLSREAHLGPVADSDMNTTPASAQMKMSSSESSLQKSIPSLLRSVVNIHDFELSASQILPARSFAFFKSGAEDEETVQWNQNSWKRIRFCPRVLRPIRAIDLTTSILGTKYSAPFFICPAGGGKLAHPSGDLALTKAAGKHGILHWVPNNTGCSQEQLADARADTQTLYWQIYALEDLSVTEKEIKQAISLGYRGFALTVDANRVGKRERDVRLIIREQELSEKQEGEDNAFASGPTVSRSHLFPDFDWMSAVSWLRKITDLPIAIKGIQSWEDAALCMKYGVHPWLSNHGGRQLEGAPSAVDTLLAIHAHCPEVLRRCDVIVDGGISRGSDIVKALALGAKGVGLGRAFLYALALGEPGVDKAIRILKNEVETTMALLGVASVDSLNPSYISAFNDHDRLPRGRSNL
ncbi:oxidoreductase [Aspergillus piperis CBS 112811]|uniref:Oxidoreductase n=1 Tax=Aspergillus piperis CBS 112811 TaxID=1448313 RepID=A0A8G1R464_9EURO|nr:oxidoreductase [Aspergillus piperis CBS 112811]RAH58938.1 oxidoreductase [Aspergillus piperis CBS 112811]